MLRQILLGVTAALTAACGTGIKITKVGDEPVSLEGAPWNLPMTQYSITITRQITKCGTAIDGQIETLVSSGIALDPDQRYLLSSRGWFSTSSIHSQLAASGISTSLNASSEDQTGAVISNVIGTAAQFAIGVAAMSKGFTDNNLPPPAEVCEENVRKAVAELYPTKGDSLEKILKKRTQGLAKATADVALLSAQVHYDKTLKPQLMAALEAQQVAKDALDIAQANLDVALKLTTHAQVVIWPLTGSEHRRAEPFEIDDSVLDKWLVNEAAYPAARPEFAVYASLLTLDRSKRMWMAPTPAPAADLKVGVPVRIARPARLLVCAKKICDPTMGETALPGEDVFMADGTTLQFGTTYVVPAAGGHFKSESAAITLDISGAPTSIQIDEKVAAAAAATAAAKDAATQIAALPASIAAAKLAKTKAETDQINAAAALTSARATSGLTSQTAQVKAQTDLLNAQSALDQANANIGAKNETAGVEAQTALLKAQEALEAAKAAADIAPEKSALGAQASLINAEVAQLNAAAARAKARAEIVE